MKKYKVYKGICIIDIDGKREKALKLTKKVDVWEIGKQYSKKLQYITPIQRGISVSETDPWVR